MTQLVGSAEAVTYPSPGGATRLTELTDYGSVALTLAAANAVNVLQLAANLGILTGTGTATNPYMGWDQIAWASGRTYYFPAGHYKKLGSWVLNWSTQSLQNVSFVGEREGTFVHIIGTNAVQKLYLQDYASGGTYDLWYGGAKVTLAWNASAATIQTALRTLTGLSGLTVDNSWTFNDGSAPGTPGNPFKITLAGGAAPYPVLTGDPTNLTGDPAFAYGQHPVARPLVVCLGEAAIATLPYSTTDDFASNVTIENFTIDCTATCAVGIQFGHVQNGVLRHNRAYNFTTTGATYGIAIVDDCTYPFLNDNNFGAWGLHDFVGLDGQPNAFKHTDSQYPQLGMCPSIGLHIGGGPFYNGSPYTVSRMGQFLGMWHHVPDTSDPTKVCLGSTTGADNQIVISGFTVTSAVKTVLLTSGSGKTVRGFYPVSSVAGQTLTLVRNPRLNGGETNIRVVINPTPLPMTGIGAQLVGGTNGYNLVGTVVNVSENFGVHTGSYTRGCVFNEIDSEYNRREEGSYTLPIVRGAPTITASATGNKFVRTVVSGDTWLTDGFRVGQRIYSRGWANAANNGYWTISTLTATDMAVTGTTLVTEGASGSAGLSLDVLDGQSMLICGKQHTISNADAGPRLALEGQSHRIYGGRWGDKGAAYLSRIDADACALWGIGVNVDPTSRGFKSLRIDGNPYDTATGGVYGTRNQFPTDQYQFVAFPVDTNGNLNDNANLNKSIGFGAYGADKAVHQYLSVAPRIGFYTKFFFGLSTGAVYFIAAPNNLDVPQDVFIFQSAGGKVQIQDENGNPLFQNGYDGSKWFEDLKLGNAGNGFYIKEGANATMGTAVLNGTTNVTVNTNRVTASSRIMLAGQSGTIANAGTPRVTGRTAGTSFTIASTNAADTGTVAWLIMEPA